MLQIAMLLMLADPLVGTWKMRIDKDKQSHVESQTITITAQGNGHKWSYDTVMKGNPKHLKYSIVTDRKAGTFKLTTEDGKPMGEGKLIIKGQGEWEVESPNHKSHGKLSLDGKTMTVVATVPTAITLVFDKQ